MQWRSETKRSKTFLRPQLAIRSRLLYSAGHSDPGPRLHLRWFCHDLRRLLLRHFPELRLDPQFIRTLNQAADVVAEQLTERFVLHRGVRLRAEAIPELRLDHREGRLDVAPLVVVGE